MERFVALSDLVAERYNLQPVWTSSPAQEEIALLETTQTLPISACAGQREFTLNQMSCLLSRSSHYIALIYGNHSSGSQPQVVPLVALYGPTIGERCLRGTTTVRCQQCPLPTRCAAERPHHSYPEDYPCIPCGKAGCDDAGGESPCMLGIEVDEVIEAV